MSLRDRFSPSSAALARMRAVRVVQHEDDMGTCPCARCVGLRDGSVRPETFAEYMVTPGKLAQRNHMIAQCDLYLKRAAWTNEEWDDFFASLNASHQADMVTGRCRVEGCGEPLISPRHSGINYFCLHQQDGNQQPCEQSCNSFGSFG